MRTQGYLAFVIGMCLTAWTCMKVSDAQQARISNTFQRDTDKIAADTSTRLKIYFDTLLSIKGAFTINDKINRAQFVRYVDELDIRKRYPGFQAIQFVRDVPDGDVPRFEASVRGDTSLLTTGYPDFAVHPVVKSERHYIIEYSEPLAGNEIAFGLDLAALPPHRAALELGRDSGQLVATERITLVQDKTGEPGFVARAPVYRQDLPATTVAQRRAALVGWVAIVFRVNNLMQEVLDPVLAPNLAIRIDDAGDGQAAAPPAPDKLMFSSPGSGARPIPGMVVYKHLDVAQRRWVMRLAALEGPRYSQNLTPVVLVALGGTLVSMLIAALLIAWARSRALAAQVRGALEEQRAFQDSASVGIALFAHGQVVRCNRGMEDIMGYGPGELAGQPSAILTQGHEQAFRIDPLTRRAQSELELVRRDGSVMWCLINGKAVGESPLAGEEVWVIQDISDRKHAEAALLDARDGLQTSLSELARQKASVEAAQRDLSNVLNTLNQAQTNLITSEKMASLGSLVAGIAHELNTPIGNSLLTATALDDMVRGFEKQYADGGIKRSALETMVADTKTACSIMTSSLHRAADLITSFKQVAVDQTSDQRRRFNLSEVIGDTCATFAAQFKRANCDTRIDCPPGLVIDSYPGGVGQVLSNLINNALLHAFEGRAHASMTISVRETGDGHLMLVFADDGVGMPPRILHQVFDPFFTTKMGQGGSGLGMNIVYNIVTGMLGGSIAIESSPGQGTTVTIRMPCVAPRRDGEGVELKLLSIP
ncbi:CHASE domain-containing protein [Massilia sp. PAMC28688]|uniref:CHASE domain-containing protein n=1 Tax=Massilia sp. PAMC28688 TaxID=2861283 RepID=UPI001C638E22|nr:CHASE domain-containing protein [Massilia sp. PAMC28688]QYF91809.1 CHASE domain-containing protein [Massilia sp. PAMC28688]